MERETGFEPATNSLEGCDSTPELLPHAAHTAANREPKLLISVLRDRFPVIGGQGRIRTSVARSAADLQSAAINHSATCPSSLETWNPPEDETVPRPHRSAPPSLWSRRWDLNPQPSDYKSDALPLELRRRDGRPSKSTPFPTARIAESTSANSTDQGALGGERCRTAS